MKLIQSAANDASDSPPARDLGNRLQLSATGKDYMGGTCFTS
jgi:hypothetical protein